MGKGDMRTKRGKISRGTSGKTRPKNSNAPQQPAAAAPAGKK